MIEYHILHDGRRWEVHRDHAFTGQFAFDADSAVGLAIRTAQIEVRDGHTPSVCVGEVAAVGTSGHKQTGTALLGRDK